MHVGGEAVAGGQAGKMVPLLREGRRRARICRIYVQPAKQTSLGLPGVMGHTQQCGTTSKTRCDLGGFIPNSRRPEKKPERQY